MNSNNLLSSSICNVLQQEIDLVTSYWAEKDSPAFIRVEGGEKRRLFISTADMLEISPETYSPFTPDKVIKLCHFSQNTTDEMLEVFSRLSPGSALVVLDSDSDSVEVRQTPHWFVILVP